MTRLISQNKAVIDYLDGGQSLTSLKALRLFGCARLSARIQNLRQKGHNIITEMITTPQGKRVAKYTLIKRAHGKEGRT